jgi:hypothetical protein
MTKRRSFRNHIAPESLGLHQQMEVEMGRNVTLSVGALILILVVVAIIF